MSGDALQNNRLKYAQKKSYSIEVNKSPLFHNLLIFGLFLNKFLSSMATQLVNEV